MAKKAKGPTPGEIDEVSQQAVVRVLQSPEPLKLKGKGESLFPSATGVNGAAIKKCLESNPPWLIDHKSEVVPTPAGFLAAVPQLDPDRVGELAAKLAPDVQPASARLAFLSEVIAQSPTAVVALEPLQEAAITDEQSERDTEQAKQAKQRETEQAAVTAMERWKAGLARQKDERIAALKRALAAEGVTADTTADNARSPVTEPERVGPTTHADLVFRRDVARQLAASWQKTWEPDRPEVRDYLEAAMYNVRGLEMIGEPGESVRFDGLRYEGGAGLSQGHPAVIVRPGWSLVEGDDATHVVLKAHVEKAG